MKRQMFKIGIALILLISGNFFSVSSQDLKRRKSVLERASQISKDLGISLSRSESFVKRMDSINYVLTLSLKDSTLKGNSRTTKLSAIAKERSRILRESLSPTELARFHQVIRERNASQFSAIRQRDSLKRAEISKQKPQPLQKKALETTNPNKP
jgi:hypothetical protein